MSKPPHPILKNVTFIKKYFYALLHPRLEKLDFLGCGGKIPIIILISFILLVPLVRCSLFFDSYIIKLWIVEFGVAVLFIYFCKQIKLQINPAAGYLLLGYLLINILSWILIPPPHRYPALLTTVALVFYILLCIFVSQYIKENRIAVALWIITASGISICSIWQYIHDLRVIGTLGNENFLAGYMGISIPVCIGLFSTLKHRLAKIGLAISILLLLTTLYLTHARGGWLGLFGSVSGFIIIGFCPKGKRLIITILLISLLIGIVLTPWGVRFVLKQFMGDVRPAIWKGTWDMITDRPLLGWGKGAYFIFYPIYRIQEYWLSKSPTDLTVHAHNEFLQLWAETGLLGLAFFLSFIYVVLRSCIRKIDKMAGQHRYLLLGLICGIIGLLVHNLVCNNLQMPSSAIFLWFTIGMAMSYIPSRTITISGRVISLALALLMAIIILQIAVRPLVSQYFFRKGWEYRDKEKWDFVIERYTKAIKWWPWDVEMHYRMAYAYSMNKQNDMAIEKYKDVIKLAPLYGSVHRNMGIVYMKLEKYRLAARSFLQALRINEYDLITQVNLSRIKGHYGNQ